MSRIPLEERIAIQDLMTDYCYAVDKLTDVDDLLALFTEDAVLDFSDIGLPLMRGRAEHRAFFESVFADMSHHTHYISNFRLDSYDGSKATMRAYVQGLGRAKDGNEVLVHVRYRMDCVKQQDGWKCEQYFILGGMPMPGSLTDIHGDR
ncbi:MAG: nuclear transport factor 2 family protein [Novosphingobium sp.]|jgi:ketosteroid isomerase-like protein|nr:nuclear transport factor 2 family protein [Novosphingobium sp.]